MEKNERQVEDIVGSTGSINLSPVKQDNDSVIDLSSHVHHLPCCIKFTGPTHVSHYFKPKSTDMQVDGLQVQEAFFRGRKLNGVTLDLPHGYSGFIIGKKKFSEDKTNRIHGGRKASEISNGNDNTWEMLAKSGNMTFWNHDSLPSQEDASLRLFHLFSVAKALHEPLSAEDLNSA
ncbi:uncharacterized protein LOC141587118 [Silene latifolia]|uniref:uncharacterized protein LOC141587118 n=1 Tax=Silene latifolia TaxID=37657 RepID=UPI003D76B5D4